jgi:GTPase
LVHVLDGTAEDTVAWCLAIRKGVELFDKRLARKKEVVLVNKTSFPGVQEAWEGGGRQRLCQAIGPHKRIAVVSAKRRIGHVDVMKRLRMLVNSVEDDNYIVVLGDEELEPDLVVEKEKPGLFRISGMKVERAYRMTSSDFFEGIDSFQRILKALGDMRCSGKLVPKTGMLSCALTMTLNISSQRTCTARLL